MQGQLFSLHAQMEERHWWFLGRRMIVCELIRYLLPPSAQKTVVDIGCGTGGNIASLVTDYSCVGMDPSEKAIRLARERFPGTRFICSSRLVDLTEVGKEADLFLLMDVLEHAPDDFLLLSELLSLAKPGAHLLLTVPADMGLWSEHDVAFGHYRRYDARRLELLWSELPVAVPLVSYYNSRLYPIIRAVRSFNRLAGRTHGMAGTDFQMPNQPVNEILKRIFASESRS